MLRQKLRGENGEGEDLMVTPQSAAGAGALLCRTGRWAGAGGLGAGSSRELGGDLAPSGSARAPRPERGAGAGVAGSRGRPLGTGSAVRWGRAGEAQSAAGRRVFLYQSFQERVVKVWSEWVMAHGSGRMARDFFY